MLAASLSSALSPDESHAALRYPVLATPKLDGIRCVISDLVRIPYDRTPLTRSLKPIPNRAMSTLLSQLPIGLDGELMARGTFQSCQSAVMSEAGIWEFTYNVFDVCPFSPGLQEAWVLSEVTGYQIPYWFRVEYLKTLDLPEWCVKILPTEIQRGGLAEYNEDCLEKGYEGSVIRTPPSPYKYGRSTLREQWMVKVKQFVDDEAVVTGYEEEMHNANEAKTSALGYQERSSHQANMAGKGRLGALVVCHPTFGEFRVGSGFNHQDREELWRDRDKLPGRVITFRYQPQGVKDKPRIPVFRGFRDARDMDPVVRHDPIISAQEELL